MGSYWKFCEDFGVLEKFLSKKELNELIKKLNFNVKGMQFAEFLQSLEELAKRIYKSDSNLPTNYDKCEELYIFLGLDDPAKFHKKIMSENHLANNKDKLVQEIAKPIAHERNE